MRKPKPLNCPRHPDESESAAIARFALSPATQAAITLEQWHTVNADVDPNAIREELLKRAEATVANDLGRLEAMLTAQAHSLDGMFNNLARRAYRNLDEYPDAADRYMRLALKAQGQCRANVEALAEMKNPTAVAFVQQANIAAGPQQVNNGTGPARVRAENPNLSNELLEGGHGNRLEHGAPGAAGTGDSSLATLGQGNRATIRLRKGKGSAE